MADCKCGRRAVFREGEFLCREHLSDWLREKTESVLDRHVLDSDILAVAVSGGKDSTALLDISAGWARAREIGLFAICIDEGIEGYRQKNIEFLKEFCKSKDISLSVVSFKEEFGRTLDECMAEKREVRACTLCGTLRRYLLNRHSRKMGATKILFAHNRDDELQTFFMNLFSGNLPQISRKGELVGIVDHPLFVLRLKPFIQVPERALATHALLNYKVPEEECPYLEESSRVASRKFINEIESKLPGSKSRIMDNYIGKILPSLKRGAPGFHTKLKECEVCGEPASGETCKTCEFRKVFGLR